MDFLEPSCAARSLGPANDLLTTFVSSILALHCNISNPDIWPPDHGEDALQNGQWFICIWGHVNLQLILNLNLHNFKASMTMTLLLWGPDRQDQLWQDVWPRTLKIEFF